MPLPPLSKNAGSPASKKYLGKLFISPLLRGPFFIFLIILTILLSLGTWQVFRLHWKQNLLQTQALQLQKPLLKGEDILNLAYQNPNGSSLNYRMACVQGVLVLGLPFKLLGQSLNGQNGYHIVAPLKITPSNYLLVDMGWVPAKLPLDQVELPQGLIKISGILLKTSGRTSYTPSNVYTKQELFSIEPLEIHKMLRDSQSSFPVPVYLRRLSANAWVDPYPHPLTPPTAPRNWHLAYAITWYFLALIWTGIFYHYVRMRFLLPTRQSSV